MQLRNSPILSVCCPYAEIAEPLHARAPDFRRGSHPHRKSGHPQSVKGFESEIDVIVLKIQAIET